MIAKLTEKGATTEGIKNYIFSYDKDGFVFWPYQGEKVKFMSTEHDKYLNFLDTLELMVSVDDVLRWHKKQ